MSVSAPHPPTSDALAELRAERDLQHTLLALGEQDELEPFVDDSLSLVMDLARARRGYLELRGLDSEREGDPEFWVGRTSPSEGAEAFRKTISRSVIGEVLATGKTVMTNSALADPRFAEKGSVRRMRIEAVLCAPVGRPPHGVIYLQDRHEPGPFSEDDRVRVEMFARHLAPMAERLLLRHERERRADPTLALRQTIDAANIIGRSEAIAQVLRQVTLVAPHDVSVLLEGPTGTGKSELARVIHANGPRRDHPFVALNCAALPDALIENELFGAAAGAHSAALRPQEGKIRAAENGTLFLDEIGELSLGAQAKLLQLLQSGDYYPLGSVRPVRANVRIMAATNRDLRQAIADRTFREDLYYRLSVLPIRLPSLAERRDDVPLLAEHCCRRMAERTSLAPLPFSLAAVDALRTAEWPGNVRQLAHTVEAALLRACGEGAEQIEVRHLFPELAPEANDEPVTFQQQVQAFKKRLLVRTLEETGWNVSEASRRLDLARSQLNELIRAFGLRRGSTR